MSWYRIASSTCWVGSVEADTSEDAIRAYLRSVALPFDEPGFTATEAPPMTDEDRARFAHLFEPAPPQPDAPAPAPHVWTEEEATAYVVERLDEINARADSEEAAAYLRGMYATLGRPHVKVTATGPAAIILVDEREEGLVGILERNAEACAWTFTEPGGEELEHLEWIGNDW